jgi:hypothetical protein
MSEPLLKCGFCQKSQDEVRKMIEGPTICICDECIEVCVDIIADDERLSDTWKDAPERGAAVAKAFRREPGSCALCGATAQPFLAIPDRGLLCADCADAVDRELAKGKPLE